MYIVGIILIVILAIFLLLFVAYITNADGKMIEKTYNFLIKYHDKKSVEKKLKL